MKSTHSQRLERWIGVEQVNQISLAMRGFYGGPIPLANAGGVWATPDGDFVGKEPAGGEACLRQRVLDIVNREQRRRLARNFRRQIGGFSSVGDLISELTTGGKGQYLNVAKTGVTGVAGIANMLWNQGAFPAAGAVTSATEVIPTNATTGSMAQANAAGGDTLHFISASISGTVANNTLLMSDLFQYYTHNIATQNISSLGASVTRYQDATAAGVVITPLVAGVLGGTVGNWQPVYTNQAGTASQTPTTQALVSTAIAARYPFAVSVGNGWWYPLVAGDTGVRKLTAINQSVATGTGTITACIHKPLVWVPIQLANIPMIIGGVTSALNLVRVVDNACLVFTEINKGATTATSYSGQVVLCSG